MTAPTDDVVSAATKFLLSKTDLRTVVGSSDGQPWITQYRLWHEFEGSESTAIVLTNEGGWTGPNLSNTLRFPRLMVSIWGDPQRDRGHNVVNYGEVMRRLEGVALLVDRYLHRPQGGTQMWSSIRVIESIRLTEPDYFTIPDGDGAVRCQVNYALTLG